MSTARAPRLAVAAWAVAAAVSAALGLSVVHYLSGGPGMQGSAGLGMRVGDALTRGGARSPVEPLWGAALLRTWQLDTPVVAILVLVGAAYLTGVALVPLRDAGRGWPLHRTTLFFAGLAVIAFATNGSIGVYDQVLFTAHMAGHLALVMVAPALVVAGRPLGLAVAASRPSRQQQLMRISRGRVAALLTAPPVALASYAVAIVGSHLTGLMNTIMANTWAGQVEHVVYVLVGCQFFVLIIGDEPIRWRLASPARWLLLAVAMAVDTFTGIVLMQGTAAIRLAPSSLGVDALADTHTGGAIMWFGGDAIMAAIMVWLVIRWLRQVDSAPAERGWLEQARSATFTAHTGAGPVDAQLDADDDAARAAYNDWLARLERQP